MILRGAKAYIRALVTDVDGAAIADPGRDEEAPDVSVTIVKDSDGEELPGGDAEYEGGGIYRFELGAVPTLDRLTVTWDVDGESEFTTVEEVVGARMCSLEAITEDVAGAESFTGAKLRRARDIAEILLEDECGVAFRPRYAREVHDGDGGHDLLLEQYMPLSIRRVWVGGEEIEVDDLALYPSGALYRPGGWAQGRRNIEVVYEHGFEQPPATGSRAAALLARHVASRRLSNLDDRATMYSTDEATYSLVTPGMRGAITALPEVNAFIVSHQYPGGVG